tara:strand:+ start:60376 stop:60543 length:168 start_codon:yes stop_codon:yes gene_type:complete
MIGELDEGLLIFDTEIQTIEKHSLQLEIIGIGTKKRVTPVGATPFHLNTWVTNYS